VVEFVDIVWIVILCKLPNLIHAIILGFLQLVTGQVKALFITSAMSTAIQTQHSNKTIK
jgi:hypothetical protein